MKNTMRTAFIVLTAVAVGAVSTASRAVTVTYNIDPAQSNLALSGLAFGLLYGPQVPGSNIDSWGGTITADLTGGVLTFSGGSSIVADLHPLGPFSTAPFPSVAGGDNYGVMGSGNIGAPYGNVVVNGAYRSLSLDIMAGTSTNGAASTGMSLQFTGASKLDWGATTDLGPTGGTSSLVGVSGTNSSAALVSLTPTTLTLPVKFQTPGSNRLEIWQGTLVANLVPEPSTAVLGGLCGLVALWGRRRK